MDTNATFNENDELIRCCYSNITLIVENLKTFGKGTLYVADSNLYWKNCNQVISMNYDAMRDFNKCNHPVIHEKPCMVIIIDLNYNTPDVDEVDQNEDKEKEKKSSMILLVPDRQECVTEIYKKITEIKSLEFRDIGEGSDRESYLTENESEEHEDSDNNSHTTSSSTFILEDQEDSDNNSHTTSSSTSILEDQEAGSIDVSNQYHELDAKNGEKENQDEEVLINERKRKSEDLPEKEKKPTKLRKLWNLIKYPFQRNTSFDTSTSENEPNISINEAIAGKKNLLELDTAGCENNSDSVEAEKKNSENISEADGENEDTSINETSHEFCKIIRAGPALFSDI